MASSVLRLASTKLFRTQLGKKPFQFQVASITDHERNMIGRREIVGFGHNGQPIYWDLTDFPFPALRWREPTPEIDALHEKEKGDWNELTCEEKKKLYRASFCQTLAEVDVATTGEWKSVCALLFFTWAPAFLLTYYWRIMVWSHFPLPVTFDEDRRMAVFRRYLDLKANPVQGLASKWDYEKDDWKNPNDPWKAKFAGFNF